MADPKASTNAATDRAHEHKGETPKEVIMSIIISFAVVFIFTRFVVASYVIPTGSMAPTLMGAHIRLHSDVTGRDWAVNPHRYLDRNDTVPARVQENVQVTDPVTGRVIQEARTRLHKGDHIFVQHYLYAIAPPARWDVVVFKYPGRIRENYIKRLVGLPGEQIMIVDGDIFTRPLTDDAEPESDWSIQRKPDFVQGGLWSTLFSSEQTPLDETFDGRIWQDRWLALGQIERENGRYRVIGDRSASLAWSWSADAIDDFVSYNDTPRASGVRRFPVADLRLRASVTPEQEGVRVVAAIDARRHRFEAVIENDRAVVRMAPLETDGGDLPPTELAATTITTMPVGQATRLAFIHSDQRLQLWINEEKILEADYDWGPIERLRNTLDAPPPVDAMPDAVPRPDRYLRPEVRWSVEGGRATLARVGLDRDVYYQPVPPTGRGRGAGPDDPVTLLEDHFFVLGDNSAASGDSRVWDAIDPWVVGELDAPVGVVPRELMMGKAFFVFWPAPKRLFGLPILPDFGRIRFIR